MDSACIPTPRFGKLCRQKRRTNANTVQASRVSINPSGNEPPLPTHESCPAQFTSLRQFVAEQRKAGRGVSAAKSRPVNA